MKAPELNVVEGKPRGKRWSRAYAVTRSARSFGMTRAAKIRRACRANAVLTNPITVVNDMTRRKNVLAGKIDMTTIAVAGLPRVLMLVTAEARGHRRSQRNGLCFRDAEMTLDTIAMHGGHVFSMIETQMLARHLGEWRSGRGQPGVTGSTTISARSL